MKVSFLLFFSPVETFNEKNEKIAFNQTGVFVQRAGGFGGKRSSDKQIMPQDAPKRPPDASIKEVTGIDQVVLQTFCSPRKIHHPMKFVKFIIYFSSLLFKLD